MMKTGLSVNGVATIKPNKGSQVTLDDVCKLWREIAQEKSSSIVVSINAVFVPVKFYGVEHFDDVIDAVRIEARGNSNNRPPGVSRSTYVEVWESLFSDIVQGISEKVNIDYEINIETEGGIRIGF